MNNVEKIDETGLNTLRTYRGQLSYLNINVKLDNYKSGEMSE